MHIYERGISIDDPTDSLSVIVNLIPANRTVLDLGVGSGALGKFLKAHKNAIVDGVTINPEEARAAAAGYRRVELADLDQCDLTQLFHEERYDFIVCADVFEHLKTPDALLDQLSKLMTQHGQLIASIPNAAYAGLVAELLDGDFQYRTEGLLDATHLRFFTLKTLQRWFTSRAWHINQVHRIQKALTESEFPHRLDALPPAVGTYLVSRPDSLVYQYVLVCTPGAPRIAAPETLPTEPHNAPSHADFIAQLYWAQAGEYAEHRKVIARGSIGLPGQTLSFSLEALQGQSVTSILLDPSDRIGYQRLHSMALYSDDDTLLWAWDVQDPQAPSEALRWNVNDLLLFPPSPTADGMLMLIHGEDPQIELPLPAHLLQTIANRPTRFEIRISWPMSADYVALAPVVHELTSEKSSLQQALSHTQQELEATKRQQAKQLQDIVYLQEKLDALKSQLTQAHGERTRIQHERQTLQQHLQWIEQSTVFRATRPLVRFKMALDRLLKPAPTNSMPRPSPATSPFNDHRRPSVDIIVPVYRGLNDTRACLEALVASRYAMPVRLIVINDCSPEPELVEWLQTFAQSRHPIAVELLHNEENLGFVGTVNRGMQHSTDCDVVLVNSDAETASGWLDRLQAAAYSGERIATATPFSNNATICSYPRFCHDNPLPLGETVQSLDALCRQHLAGHTVDIPTAHGFCMYIRRSALSEVGLFDQDTFGKGYGEENDFCLRATARGWRHVHALDVFVRHAGGVSFGTSKTEGELKAIEIIRQRYPDYEATVHRYIQADPAAWARLVLDIGRILRSERQVILNITHNRNGGTHRHQIELAQTFAQNAIFLQLQPTATGVELGLCGPHEALSLAYRLPNEFHALLDTLKALRVSHIHIHHTLGHANQVLQLPALLNIPYDFTAHDYFAYCPQISLTDHRDRYCGESGIEQCRQCLAKQPAPEHLSIEAWHERHRPLLSHARHVICPTESVAQRMRRFAPLASIVVAPHLDVNPSDFPPVIIPQNLQQRPLKIVVIGAMSRIKGADQLEQVALLAARQKLPLDFHLIGYAYRSLAKRPQSHLTIHGAYEDSDLPQLLQWLQPDVAWFPAQWPETYSYTLSACLQAGLPIVASNLGAFADRLHLRPASWLEPWDSSADQWIDCFMRIRQEWLQPPERSSLPSERNSSPERAGWRYATHYLSPTSSSNSNSIGADPQFSAFEMALALQGRSAGRMIAGHKGLLLRALERLRTAPGLSWLARRIPAHTQRRIKNLLTHPRRR